MREENYAEMPGVHEAKRTRHEEEEGREATQPTGKQRERNGGNWDGYLSERAALDHCTSALFTRVHVVLLLLWVMAYSCFFAFASDYYTLVILHR